ncbi:hypothetical protein BLOT_005646 [Blomia tropicalis]|nr:hypothetical protein BLOT_005646 [Blomia tropicalis]
MPLPPWPPSLHPQYLSLSSFDCTPGPNSPSKYPIFFVSFLPMAKAALTKSGPIHLNSFLRFIAEFGIESEICFETAFGDV